MHCLRAFYLAAAAVVAVDLAATNKEATVSGVSSLKLGAAQSKEAATAAAREATAAAGKATEWADAQTTLIPYNHGKDLGKGTYFGEDLDEWIKHLQYESQNQMESRRRRDQNQMESDNDKCEQLRIQLEHRWNEFEKCRTVWNEIETSWVPEAKKQIGMLKEAGLGKATKARFSGKVDTVSAVVRAFRSGEAPFDHTEFENTVRSRLHPPNGVNRLDHVMEKLDDVKRQWTVMEKQLKHFRDSSDALCQTHPSVISSGIAHLWELLAEQKQQDAVSADRERLRTVPENQSGPGGNADTGNGDNDKNTWWIWVIVALLAVVAISAALYFFVVAKTKTKDSDNFSFHGGSESDSSSDSGSDSVEDVIVAEARQ